MLRLPEDQIANKLKPFDGSKVLSASEEGSLGMAHFILLCIPLHPDATSLPSTRLVYASWQSGAIKSVQAMLDAAGDDVGSTVVLLRSGSRTFGGYASESFRKDGASFGDSKSFLFSASLDLKLPFHGRKLLPPPPKIVGDDIPIEAHVSSVPSLVAGSDFLQFGVSDLVLRGGLLKLLVRA